MAAHMSRGGSGIQSDEDYWGSSSATSTKRQNIFDDRIDLDTAKRFLTHQRFDDEVGEEEVINWDDSAPREEVKSARFRPQLISQTGKTTSNSSDAGRYGREDSHSSIQESISDALLRDKRQPTLTDISKLQAENSVLRRNLDEARKDRKLTPRETVSRLILGENYTLEKYKSREEKLQLLDESIALHDGNAIIATLLFMRDTVKPPIFNLELMRRPVAVEQYILFLRQQTEMDSFNQLVDLLGMLGRSEEAAMLKYKQAVKQANPDVKKKALQNCLGSHFLPEISLGFESSLITEQISLLETQLPVESSDSSLAQRKMSVFKDGRRYPLLETPVISTLFYSCVYHYDEKENVLSSPISIRSKHQLTEKQFLWTAIRARGMLKQWNEVAKLFETKGWLGGLKMKSAIGFDRVLSLLKELEAPRSELNKYCNLIEGLDRRLEIGLKYGCCESVIETYKLMRERQSLLTYEASLPPNSPEQFHAASVLRDNTIKWKN